MAEPVSRIEKNLQTSFSYVKKDLLMVNDSIADLQGKIQHLSLNHASLLGEMANLRREVNDLRDDVKKKVNSSSKAKKR